MNRLIFFVPAVFVLVVGAVFTWVLWIDLDTETIPTPLKDKALPAFSLPSVYDADQMLSNADFDGQGYMLNVWATWCITCRVEHPELKRLADKGVNIVGLNYKDSRAEALKWLAQYKDPFSQNIYDEEGTLGFDLGVTGAPETFFVRSDGTIAHKHVGEINSQLWESELKSIYESL